jgi:DNA-nicking Smr family endonuclease
MASRLQEKIAAQIAWRSLFAATRKVDLHGKSVDEAEKIIDRLSMSHDVVEVVTGHGKGIMKKLLHDLQGVYGYHILSVAPNNASFVVDFT